MMTGNFALAWPQRLAALGVLACLLQHSPSSCSGDEVNSLPDDVVVHYNLAYRAGASQSWKLDLALPRSPADGLRPAVVVIHGGGWLEGSRTSFSRPPNLPPGNIVSFAQRGFVAATIDYRLSREATYPAALNDCRCAVRWLRANSERYGIDPQRIGAWGNSAGGHLALLLGLVDDTDAAQRDEPYAEYSSRVQAVVSDSGPIDLVHQYEHKQIPQVIEWFLGGPPDADRLAAYREASPSNYVTAEAPPLLLIYGTADEQVGVETADRFIDGLQRAGHRDVSYLRVGTAGHCPQSLLRVPWVAPAVDAFFLRTLMRTE